VPLGTYPILVQANNRSGDTAGTRAAQMNSLYNALAEQPRVENSGASGMGGLAQHGGQLGGTIPNMTELYRQASMNAMNSLVESAAAAQANGTVSCVNLAKNRHTCCGIKFRGVGALVVREGRRWRIFRNRPAPTLATDFFRCQQIRLRRNSKTVAFALRDACRVHFAGP
jgi:hypothetical protein